MFKLFHACPRVEWPFEDYLPKQPGREYRRVADIAVDNINDVFRLTQNLETPWTDGPYVRMAEMRRRSTSIGDVIQTEDGRTFVVAPLGLEEVTAAEPDPEVLHVRFARRPQLPSDCELLLTDA